MKSGKQKADEKTICSFLSLCAPSLDPEAMDAVACAVGQLVKNRGLDRKAIPAWALKEVK